MRFEAARDRRYANARFRPGEAPMKKDDAEQEPQKFDRYMISSTLNLTAEQYDAMPYEDRADIEEFIQNVYADEYAKFMPIEKADEYNDAVHDIRRDVFNDLGEAIEARIRNEVISAEDLEQLFRLSIGGDGFVFYKREVPFVAKLIEAEIIKWRDGDAAERFTDTTGWQAIVNAAIERTDEYTPYQDAVARDHDWAHYAKMHHDSNGRNMDNAFQAVRSAEDLSSKDLALEELFPNLFLPRRGNDTYNISANLKDHAFRQRLINTLTEEDKMHLQESDAYRIAFDKMHARIAGPLPESAREFMQDYEVTLNVILLNTLMRRMRGVPESVLKKINQHFSEFTDEDRGELYLDAINEIFTADFEEDSYVYARIILRAIRRRPEDAR